MASGGVSLRSTLALRLVEALDVDLVVEADVAHHGENRMPAYGKLVDWAAATSETKRQRSGSRRTCKRA